MPPPLASAIAASWAWVLDALAGDEALDLGVSTLQTLVSTLPEGLAGAPDATRERVALRCMQKVASMAPGDDAAARSCETLLEQIGKVGCSGVLHKDMLPPFSQDIQNVICMKKSTLPKTLFELLKEVDPEIASLVPASQLEQNGSNQHGNKDNAEFQQETSAKFVNETESRDLENDMDVLQHESGDKGNQVLDDVRASIQPVEKDQVHEVLSDQGASALPSVSCNDAIQGGQSETTRPLGKATEHTTVFEGQIGDKSCVKSSGSGKVNEALHDDSSILGKTTVHVRLHVQATSVSQNCNLALHDKIAEADCPYEQNTGKSRTDAEKNSCITSVPDITRNGNGTSTTDTSINRNLGGASGEIPHVASPDDSLHHIAAAGLLSTPKKMPSGHNDQEMNDFIEVQQDMCIKCGKAGQLLKCTGCLLAAHDSCFGSSVPSQESDLFYCPVCLYTKATEAYQKARKAYHEARKNLATFLGTTQKVGQHDELANVVLPSDVNREVSGSSKRKDTHQHVAHRDEETDQQRKKQKAYAKGHGCPEETVTEKAFPVQNSNIGTVNEHSKHKDNSINQVQIAERQQLGENNETGSGNLSHETRCLSQNRSEADIEDSPTKAHQSNPSNSGPDQQRKKQKVHATGHGSPEEAVTKKASPVQNSNIEIVNKPSMHRDNSINQVQDAERQQLGENNKTGNGNLSHEARCLSQNRSEANKEDGATKAHQSNPSNSGPDQQRKTQKVHVTAHGCPEETDTEKASPVQNPDIEIVNKPSMHKDNCINQVQDSERQQLGENNETGNGNLSHETRHLSQNRSEADREDGPTKSHQSDDSSEIEVISSDDSGKRSSSPWCKGSHSNSKKATPQLDQHMPSTSRKRNYAPQKRCSNPVEAPARRPKIWWTKEEETALKEAMAKFAPQDSSATIPWVLILQYGRGVFHKQRNAGDLRVKWRNMTRKAGS